MREHGWYRAASRPATRRHRADLVLPETMWACARCGATVWRTEQPTLQSLLDEGVSLDCDAQAVRSVMDS